MTLVSASAAFKVLEHGGLDAMHAADAVSESRRESGEERDKERQTERAKGERERESSGGVCWQTDSLLTRQLLDGRLVVCT